MNFIKWLGLVLTKEAKDIWEAGEDYVTHTIRLMYVAIAIPAFLLIIGVVIGAIGDAAGILWMEGVARWSLAISGFTATLLLTLFWVRAVVFSHLVVAATKGVGWLWEELPTVELETAQAFLRWLRGITLWISAVALYAQLVPIWRNLWLSLIVGTCILIFAAMMSARWFDGVWAQRIVAAAVVAIFTCSTVALVSPAFAQSVRAMIDRNFNSADAWNVRNDRLAAVDRDAAAVATETDARLLRTLTTRQNELRRRAVELCHGDFCSATERSEYADIGERISRLREGTYWEHYGAPTRAASPPSNVPPPPAIHRNGAGRSSALPPPPSAPRESGHATASSSAHRSSSGGNDIPRRRDHADYDDVFRELEKYPDL